MEDTVEQKDLKIQESIRSKDLTTQEQEALDTLPDSTPQCPHCKRYIFEVQCQMYILLEWDSNYWTPDVDEVLEAFDPETPHPPRKIKYWCTKCGAELEEPPVPEELG